MLNKILEMLADRIATADIKVNITSHLSSYLTETPKNSVGSVLGVQNIIAKNINNL